MDQIHFWIIQLLSEKFHTFNSALFAFSETPVLLVIARLDRFKGLAPRLLFVLLDDQDLMKEFPNYVKS